MLSSAIEPASRLSRRAAINQDFPTLGSTRLDAAPGCFSADCSSLGGAIAPVTGVDYFNNPQTRSFSFSITLNH